MMVQNHSPQVDLTVLFTLMGFGLFGDRLDGFDTPGGAFESCLFILGLGDAHQLAVPDDEM